MSRTFIMPLALVAAAACGGAAEEPQPLIRSIRYIVAEKTEASTSRVFSGALEAGNESRLSFQVGGRIRAFPVKVGQRVKKGQLVAELDPTDFELQLREARANVAQAKAQANAAASSYQRVRRLYETQNTSRQDLDASRAQRDTSRAVYAAALESLQRLKRQLGYTRLEAPAEGTINTVEAEVNEVVGAGRAIATLQAGDALQAAIDVPEAFIRMVGLGDKATVKVSAVEADVEGIIQEMGVSSAGTGVFPIRVKLMTDPAKARPGMVAEVTLTPRKEAVEEPKGILVPLSAIGEDRSGRYVFIAEGEPGKEGKVKRVAVTTGVIGSRGIRIEDGVQAGQRVVVAGVSRIRNGLTVKIPAEPAGEEVP